MARVFTAVDIENKELRENLVEIRDTLDLGFNPVPAEKMHLTLEFFSDASEEDIEEIKRAMDEVEMESFEAEVNGIGAFPSEDYIRVVWAGVEEKQFRRLYEQVSQHTAGADNSYEFFPHITLMRVKDLSREEKRKLQRMIKEHQHHRLGKLDVNRIKLFKSELRPGGSVYTEIYSQKL